MLDAATGTEAGWLLLLRWYEEGTNVHCQRSCAAGRGLFEQAREPAMSMSTGLLALCSQWRRSPHADADQRSKQVVCIQISSQIATPLSALH